MWRASGRLTPTLTGRVKSRSSQCCSLICSGRLSEFKLVFPENGNNHSIDHVFHILLSERRNIICGHVGDVGDEKIKVFGAGRCSACFLEEHIYISVDALSVNVLTLPSEQLIQPGWSYGRVTRSLARSFSETSLQAISSSPSTILNSILKSGTYTHRWPLREGFTMSSEILRKPNRYISIWCSKASNQIVRTLHISARVLLVFSTVRANSDISA